jgi:hypothetical protein
VEGFMTTKRVPIVRSPTQRITTRAIDLFQYAMELEENGAAVGSAEHNRISVELHRELGRRVWDVNVLNVHVGDSPPDEPVPMKLESWATAVELRRQLEQAISEYDAARPRELALADADHLQ